MIALIWLVFAWGLFQATAGIVFAVLVGITRGLPDTANVEQIMSGNLDLLFIGNSTGQILFIGLATLLIVKLHLSGEKSSTFLRLSWKKDTPFQIIIAAALVITIYPLILFLGYLNSLVPLPESFTLMQDSQYEMIMGYLSSDGVFILALFHIALVPAVAEEVLFRGYILRAFEKSWGIFAAIIVSGLIFGLFHVQLGNILPLATLGILFAAVTWLSGSIWPAVVAHFVNNGAAVLMVTFYPQLAESNIGEDVAPPIWIVLGSVFITALVLNYMYKNSNEIESV